MFGVGVMLVLMRNATERRPGDTPWRDAPERPHNTDMDRYIGELTDMLDIIELSYNEDCYG